MTDGSEVGAERGAVSSALGRAERHAWETAGLNGARRLPRQVRTPGLSDAERNLVAAYLLVPALRQMHRALPLVVVETTLHWTMPRGASCWATSGW